MIVKPALSASVISENVISLSPIVMLLSLIITFFMVINRPFFFLFLGIKIAPFTDVKDACLRLLCGFYYFTFLISLANRLYIYNNTHSLFNGVLFLFFSFRFKIIRCAESFINFTHFLILFIGYYFYTMLQHNFRQFHFTFLHSRILNP